MTKFFSYAKCLAFIKKFGKLCNSFITIIIVNQKCGANGPDRVLNLGPQPRAEQSEDE